MRVEAHGTTVLVSVLADSSASSLTEVFAVAAADGAVLWRRAGWELATADRAVSVVTSATAVAMRRHRHGPRALEPSGSCRLRPATATWTSTEEPHAGLAGGTVALPGRDLKARDVVLGVDATTGREQWRVEVGQRQAVGLDRAVGVNPAESDLPAARGERWLVALDAVSGDQLWQRELRSDQYGGTSSRHLAADPARSQTVVADLPRGASSGCC